MKRTAAIIGVGAIVALAMPGTASAAGGPPSGAPCSVGKGVSVCFQAHGDVIWIKDNKKDGHAVSAFWGLDGNGTAGDLPYRCHNNIGSDAGWASCGKADTIPEHDEISFRAYVVNSKGHPFYNGTAGPRMSASTS